MSIDAMSWAFKQHLPAAEKLVLLSLADHHNGGTGLCIPSQASVAEQTSMSVRTVQRHMASLEKRGLIVRQPRFRSEGRGRTSDAYILQGDKLARWHQGDRTRTTKATTTDDQGDSGVVGTVSEPEVEPLATASRERPRDLLFETIAELCGYNLTALTRTARGRLNAAAKELRDINATPDQIRTIVKQYRTTYPDAPVTPQAITGNWAALTPNTTPTSCECGQTLELHDPEIHDILLGDTHD